MTPTSQTVAGEVRAEMARQRRSQAELAAFLGVSIPTVNRRFRGDIAFTIDELSKIADWLNVDMARFLSGAAA